MIGLLLLVLGGGVIALARDHRTEPLPQAQPAYSAPPPVPAQPSPLSALHRAQQIGEAPSPFLVRCAIEQAEGIGRSDLAYALTKAYVLPELTPQRARASSPASSAANAPAGAVAIVVMPSPIPDADDRQWTTFAKSLEREPVTFNTERHVGRYRQRKARLAAIGFDPESLVGSPDVQDAALVADVTDARAHVVGSGMAEAFVGTPVALPDGTQVVTTLSGLLGLATVGGLEGAAAWLESETDRQKYPHTTQAFARCNGVF